MITILAIYLLAQANGYTVPTGCWVVFAVGCTWSIFASLIKAVSDRKE